MLDADPPAQPEQTPEQVRIAQLEEALAAARGEVTAAQDELTGAQGTIQRLRRAYTHALEQLQLMRRRLFLAKAERADASTEQLAFDAMFKVVEQLKGALVVSEADSTPLDGAADDGDDDTRKKKTKTPGKGRRNLAESDLPIVRIEVSSPDLDEKAERIGVEETWRLGYERGGPCRIVLKRVVYKTDVATADALEQEALADVAADVVAADVVTATDVAATELTADGAAPTDAPVASAREPAHEEVAETATTVTKAHTIFVTTALPKELFRRSFLAPSMIAHILVTKYMLGVPFYRLEQQMALQGAPLDRGTMCRYAEDVGATLGAIVEAARKEAFETAFCLSTDATGVCIQPGPIQERKNQSRGACRKGHFFVVLADKDHVFFEYQPKHNSAAVCEMFKGFNGYIQADAHTIYDALFAGTPPTGAPPDEVCGPPPLEVGCWSHCRRGFWEAAVCKYELGVEGLRQIDMIFAVDRPFSDLAPSVRKARRDTFLRPLVDAFFTWVKAEYAKPRERGLVATALGYAIRQEIPLRRFLEDGRLRLENNASERALRPIAAARGAWLFFGSDDHAAAAANLFSLVASCKLHRLDPEAYLTDVIRAMPYWPRNRYLELAPKYWAATRARLNAAEMKLQIGPVTVPPPLPPTEQRAPG